MVYLTQVLLSAFCITSIAVFGSFIFKIKHNYSFLLSCCFIALFLNLGWKFIPINLLIYSIYLISLVCFIMSLFRRKEIDFNINTENIHLSLDVDVLDPEFMKCTGTQVEKGINLEKLYEVLQWTKNQGNIVSIDLVEYNPLCTDDEEERIRSFRNYERIFDMLHEF